MWSPGQEENPAKEIDKLKAFNINVYPINIQSLDDIANYLEKLSLYAPDPDIGQQAAKSFRQQLSEMRQKYQVDTPIRYFYQLSEQPLMTVAKNHWPSEVFHFVVASMYLRIALFHTHKWVKNRLF